MSAEIIRNIARSNVAIAANHNPPLKFSEMPNMKGMIIVSCMDPRANPQDFWALPDVPIIRNVGGLVTDDTLRSIRFLSGVMSDGKNTVGAVAVVHHTDCGLMCYSNQEVSAGLMKWAKLEDHVAKEIEGLDFGSWKDLTTLEETVKRDMKAIKSDRYLPTALEVVGFVYDVFSGETTEVSCP